MTITGQSALSRADIDRMVRDAEAHAEEDARRRDEADVRNRADTLVYQTEKLLKDQGEKISAEEKEKVEHNLAELKKALSGTDIEAIKFATETMMAASQEFAQKLYEQTSAQERQYTADGAAGRTAAGPVDDEVVDAEIVDEGEAGEQSA